MTPQDFLADGLEPYALAAFFISGFLSIGGTAYYLWLELTGRYEPTQKGENT